MAVNTTQTKYFQNIGIGADQLRFSQIATTMGLDGTSNVRFGDYKRKTGANETFADVNGSADSKASATAIIPDSEENRNCGVDGNGISDTTNHKVSSLKNLIKRYDVSYTGGSTSERTIHASGNAISTSETWDENLDRNIPKRLTIDGSTYKASTTSQHGIKFSGAALNLELKFNGTIIKGKGGAGGSAGGGNGGSAGSALYLRNNTNRTNGAAKTIKLDISNNSLIAGGGGGGGGGYPGNTSGTTRCRVNTSHNGHSGAFLTSSPSGCSTNHGGGRYFRGTTGKNQGTVYYDNWRWTCYSSYDTNGNTPGRRAGGAGGAGAGSNRTNPQGGSAGGGSSTHGNCNQGYPISYAYANAGGTGASGGSLGGNGGSSGGAGGSKGRWLNVSNTPWQHIGSTSNSILKGGVQ
jgi:hypothetical protein